MKPSYVNVRSLLLLISLALLGLAAGVTAWRVITAQKHAMVDSMIVLPEPKAIEDFTLLDHHGSPFKLDGFKGHWSLVFFGFTACPDICPSTLYQLQQARQLLLQERAAPDIPRIYLVSVDPERDTPQKLAAYVAYFDPAFIGLTGDPGQLQALAIQLGIAFFVEPHDPGAVQYNVDHGASLLLLDPLGHLFAVLPAPHDAVRIARDVLVATR